MSDLLALDWETGTLRGVALRTGGGETTLLGDFAVEWPQELAEVTDVAAVAEQLQRSLRSLHARPEKVITVLPRDAIVVRKLELPDVPDNELPDLVRLQAATKLATPVEKLVLDFLPLPRSDDHPGRSVVLVTVEGDRVRNINEALEAAGLQPLGCTTSTTTVAELAARIAAAAQGATLIAYQHGARMELSVLFERRLIFSHAVRLPSESSRGHVQPLMAELSRVLVASRQVHHDAEIQQVLVIQDGEPDELVLQTLRERFPDQVRVIDAVEVGRLAGLGMSETGRLSTPALGALLAERGAEVPAIDFLRPRKAVVARDPRYKQYGMIAAAAGVGLLIGGWIYWSMLSGRDDRIEELTQQKSELDELLNRRQTQETLDAADAITAWERGTAAPLETISRFQAHLPGTDRLYFTSLRFSPESRDAVAHIRGSGLARQRRDVEDLYQRLADAGYRVRPQTIVPGARRDPDYPFAFELDVDVLRPAEPEQTATPET
jgi:hypothetical protein